MHSFLTTALPLLAQEAVEPRSYTLSWAVIMLGMGLGLWVALKPAKREVTIKKAKETD